MNIETMLHEEIEQKLEQLKYMEVGSEEYRNAVDALTKLFDRAIEMEKNSANRADENKDRLIRNILKALEIGLPLGVTIWGVLKSLKFEETGTVTTLIGRGLLNKLLPRR